MTPASPEIRIYPNADPVEQGRAFVNTIAEQAKAAGKTVDEIRDEVTKAVKRDVEARTSSAKEVRDGIEGKTEGVDKNELVNVAKSMNAFIEALKNDQIAPPTHPPTRAVFENIKASLKSINPLTSAYLQPLINGILNVPGYIDTTPNSPFDKDLEEIISGIKDDPGRNFIHNLFFDRSRPIPTIDTTLLQKRFSEITERKSAEVETNINNQESKKGRFSTQEEQFIYDSLTMKGSPDELMATEIRDKLWKSLNSTAEFYTYYKQKCASMLDEPEYQIRLSKFGADSKHLDLVPQDKLREILEDAKRDTTLELHKSLQFLTHRIFASVIESAGHNEWGKLVAEARQGFIDPGSVFRKLLNRFSELGQKTPLFSEHNIEEKGFYQLGIEKVNTYETSKDEKTGEIKYFGHKTVEVLSSDLEKIESFKEYFERFKMALEAEQKFLEVGNNFSYIIQHGAHDTTFFKQAAQYAEHFHNDKLDELYRLPNGEIIHAARIALASQFKRQLAMKKWQKEPNLFGALFQHGDTGQHHVLVEMVRSNLLQKLPKEATPEQKAQIIGKAIPEWAIRRALIHARMHMSLISLDLHAISSYAHPPLTDKLQPTYEDPDKVFDRLETFRTWYDASKWQTTELFRYGMAFYPAPNRQRGYEVWLPADVAEEGQDMWRKSKDIGVLSRLGRIYSDRNTTLNINELNPMEVAGVERQSGWGLKRPYTPWIEHLLNYPESGENFHLKHKKDVKEGEKPEQDYRDFEIAWKSIENLGVEILNNYKNSYLFGFQDNFLNFDKDTGKVACEKHYEKFFTFLFDRYFKTGIGKETLGITYRDYRQSGMPEVSVKYSQFNTSQEFWQKVVEPILNRPDVYGEGEKPKNGQTRNRNERMALLKNIVDQALGVLIFERLPMDMVYTEDPLISQNGMTFIEELSQQFEAPGVPGGGHHEHRSDGKMSSLEFEHALHDIEYVQSTARTETIRLIKEGLKKQRREKSIDKPNTFGNSIRDIDNLRSTIKFSDVQGTTINGQEVPTGYVIDEHIIRDILQERYYRVWDSGLDPGLQPDPHDEHKSVSEQREEIVQHHVNNAVNVYRAIREKMAKKPIMSYLEKNSDKLVDDNWAEREIKFEKQRGDLEEYEKTPEILAAKKEEIKAKLEREFADNRANHMQTRFVWSSGHLLDPKMPITINDMAYPLIYFSSTGRLVVNRRLAQVAGTQEQYKSYIMGEYDSDLKKYYRKEDFETLLKSIIGVRSAAKDWVGPNQYNGIATFILENSINVMRIRSDAENALVEMQYRMEHKRRSGISGVATEGEEYPLRRQDRYRIWTEFLHDGQTPKRALDPDKVFKVDENPRRSKIMSVTEPFGPGGKTVGEMISNVADMLLGDDEAKIVRHEIEELSGEGGRKRELASMFHLLTREGPTIIMLLLAALTILAFVRGYQESEK